MELKTKRKIYKFIYFSKIEEKEERERKVEFVVAWNSYPLDFHTKLY